MKIKIEDLKGDQETKEELIKLLKEYAMDVPELSRTINVTRGALLYHLKSMEKEHLVSSVKMKNKKLYYIPKPKEKPKEKPKGKSAPGMGYCVKCKKNIMIKDPIQTIASNGANKLIGICPFCSLTVCRLGGKKALIIAPFETEIVPDSVNFVLDTDLVEIIARDGDKFLLPKKFALCLTRLILKTNNKELLQLIKNDMKTMLGD